MFRSRSLPPARATAPPRLRRRRPGRGSLLAAVAVVTGVLCTPVPAAAGLLSGPPVGSLDTVTSAGSLVQVTGWALDAGSPHAVTVHVYVNGVARQAAVASAWRPDVDAAFGYGSFHGFDIAFDTYPGEHEVCVYVLLRCADVPIGWSGA